ncbi:MAG: hypothetical protein AABW50_03940 [Nanoarchaeota archaeon]
MFTKNEIAIILLAGIILAFSITLLSSLSAFFYALISVIIIILINIFAKKITGYILDSETEFKLWEIKRFGVRPHYSFKKSFPAGAFLPVITSILTLGKIYWMAPIVFDVKPRSYRAAKRWGLYTFSEMTEWHIGVIAASGILVTLFFSLIGYLTGFSEFARLSLYYAFFNLLPISSLDGNKVFFGSIVLWSFLAILVLIGLGYALFLI